jgi:hypothetical protein
MNIKKTIWLVYSTEFANSILKLSVHRAFVLNKTEKKGGNQLIECELILQVN